MDALDRSEWVVEIWNKFPAPLVKQDNGDMAFPHDDARRAYLLLVMLPELNKRENLLEPKWGYLIKEDQGNHIPADIAVWKDTLDHFDILTDKGPTWGPHGLIKGSWKFGVVGEIPQIPIPTEPDPNGPKIPEVVDPKEIILLLGINSKLMELIESQRAQTLAFQAGLSELKNEISKGIKIKF